MKTRHARRIREGILRAYRGWNSDFYWFVRCAYKLEKKAFERTLANKWRKG